MLSFIAEAQSQMCETIEASLSLSLDAFSTVELTNTSTLRSESDSSTVEAENSLSRYLHGRSHSESTPETTNQLNNINLQLNNLFRNANASTEEFNTRRTSAGLQLTLERIRLAQANAEMKRFQLLKNLDSFKVCHLTK